MEDRRVETIKYDDNPWLNANHLAGRIPADPSTIAPPKNVGLHSFLAGCVISAYFLAGAGVCATYRCFRGLSIGSDVTRFATFSLVFPFGLGLAGHFYIPYHDKQAAEKRWSRWQADLTSIRGDCEGYVDTWKLRVEERCRSLQERGDHQEIQDRAHQINIMKSHLLSLADNIDKGRGEVNEIVFAGLVAMTWAVEESLEAAEKLGEGLETWTVRSAPARMQEYFIRVRDRFFAEPKLKFLHLEGVLRGLEGIDQDVKWTATEVVHDDASNPQYRCWPTRLQKAAEPVSKT